MTLDVGRIRKDFPILDRQVRGGRPLIYLDSANTSQKPRQVIDAISGFYERHNANIHRATHELGEEATAAYEGARIKVACFAPAPGTSWRSSSPRTSPRRSTWWLTRWATRSGRAHPARRAGPVPAGPWRRDRRHRDGTPFRSRSVAAALPAYRGHPALVQRDAGGTARPDQPEELVNERTKLVALVHQSNVLGTINPVRLIADQPAHAVGALVLADAAQSVPHMPVDVQDLGANFVGFTGHKMCGPTGIGVLWARRELLEEMPPFLGGGEMIETVWMDHSTFAAPPHKFEAGTMPIAEAAGLSAAIDYLNEAGRESVHAHEQALLTDALAQLAGIDGLRILGPAEPEDRGTAISFEVDGVHPHDVKQVLDELGIAVRAGHHCAWPLHRALGVQASSRASFYLYNTHEEVAALADGIARRRSSSA